MIIHHMKQQLPAYITPHINTGVYIYICPLSTCSPEGFLLRHSIPFVNTLMCNVMYIPIVAVRL